MAYGVGSHRYHPKHIWCSSQVLDPADVATTLMKFENSLKWKWVLRDDVMPDGFHIKGLQTVPCLQPGDPGLNVMLSIIKRRLLKACCSACVVARRDRSFFSNVLGITKLGLRLMKHRVTAVPADKEPGYVVEDFDTVRLVHLQILSGPSYSEVALASLPIPQSKEAFFAFGCSRCQVVQ